MPKVRGRRGLENDAEDAEDNAVESPGQDQYGLTGPYHPGESLWDRDESGDNGAKLREFGLWHSEDNAETPFAELVSCHFFDYKGTSLNPGGSNTYIDTP